MVASRYDFWLWDLDGTLVDIEHGYVVEVMSEVGDRLGHGFTEQEAESIWHGLGGSRNVQLAEWGIDPDRFWETFHAVEDAETRAEHAFLYDDADVVAALDGPTALVTHSQQHLTDPILDALDIRDWFDAVVCCTAELGWKPDPAPLRHAMERIDASGRGLMVGDGPQDVGAAWNAGLHGAHVERHGHDRRGLCVLGDYRVSRLDELLSAPAPASD